MQTMITHQELTESLSYNPATGIFTWSSPRPKIQVGQPAGHLKKNKGYVYIEFNGKAYSAHRLAWLYVNGVWPEKQIDHVNGIRSDNRIENLREATNGQNRANTRTSSKHGYKGVSYKKWLKEKPWAAQITFNKKVIYLGCFATAEEAHQRYCEEAKKLHGEFFRDLTP
jgi:hypothetical protein